MSLWVILPVKGLAQAKTRLQPVVSEAMRLPIARGMLTRTLGVLGRWRNGARVLVVSQDAGAMELARSYGAMALEEASPPDLNSALEQATRWARARGASAVLILPTDLPLLRSEDVDSLVRHAHGPRAVVIAPDQRREGTNALLVSPPGLIEYAYGFGSFSKHLDLARAAGVSPVVVESPGLAVDLDVPEDLCALDAYAREGSPGPKPRRERS